MGWCFAPAQAMMRRLRLPQKFLVIALVLLLPLAFIGRAYLGETGSEIDLGARQRRGVAYLAPATDLLVVITEARSAALVDPATVDRPAVVAAMEAVETVDRRLGRPFDTASRWSDLRAELDALLAAPPADPVAAGETWTRRAGQAVALLHHVADQSTLTLVPDLDSYHLAVVLSEDLPELIEEASRTADLAGRPGDDGRDGLAMARGLARTTFEAVASGIAVAAQDTEDEGLEGALGPPLERLRTSMATLQDEAQVAPVLRQTPAEVLGAVRTDAVALVDAVGKQLDGLLVAKTDDLRAEQRSMLLTAGGALAVALWLFVGFYRSVRRSVDDLVQVLAGVAAGDLGRLPAVDSRDELGAVAAALLGPIERMGRAAEAVRESEQRLRAVISNLPVVVFTLDNRGTFTLCEGQAVAAAPPDAPSVVGTSAFETYAGLPLAAASLHRALGGETVNELFEIEGEVFDVTLAPLQEPDGRQHGVIGVAADVTERHRAQERLDLLHRVTAAVSAADDVESAFAAVLADVGAVTGAAHADAWAPAPAGDVLVLSGSWSVDDGLGQFTRATEQAELPLGTGLAGHVWRDGQTRWMTDIDQTAYAASSRRRAALAGGLRTAVAAPVRTADGTVAVIELLFGRRLDRDERLVSLLDDVARQLGSLIQRKQAAAALAHRATHDELTGLPNRALFLDHLGLAMSRLSRRPVPTAVMFLDIDHFKVVNDSLGHAAGDEVLVAVAERLQRALRPGDTAARFGGDEFTVLCEDLADDTEAASVARGLAAALEVPLVVGGHELRVETSIGIAVCNHPSCTPADLLRDADAALYVAKERGRARQVVFHDAMRARSLARFEVLPALRRAIYGGELVLHYQPEIDVASGAVVGAEALVRWHDPRRGLVPPDEFIPLAEDSGLIGPLGAWAMAEAGRQLATWRERSTVAPDFLLSINVSGRQLADPGFADLVARTLGEVHVAPDQICLEITESVLMDDADASMAALGRLREVGVSLAIDDFGTGYSSLSYLRRFPVDLLKVDRSFVRGLGRPGPDGALGRAIVHLAHTVEMRAVAEGVETDDQLSELRRLHCDLAQGFLFSPPLPADDFAAYLHASRVLMVGARA